VERAVRVVGLEGFSVVCSVLGGDRLQVNEEIVDRWVPQPEYNVTDGQQLLALPLQACLRRWLWTGLSGYQQSTNAAHDLRDAGQGGLPSGRRPQDHEIDWRVR